MFKLPLFVLSCGILALVSTLLHSELMTDSILLLGILLGSFPLLKDTWISLTHKSIALDYIAILAIITGLLTREFAVSLVIVLMMSSGKALEDYANERARFALKALANRIPHAVEVIDANGDQHTQPIEHVEIGTHILVRKGEVVPLDGVLKSTEGSFDESSLTGEPYPDVKKQHEVVHSGTVNVGESVEIITTVRDAQSTYRNIIRLVDQAEKEKAPFIRLADKLSLGFTLITILLAAIAYIISHDPSRILAVLVIATPCPLLLATPIAFIGGVNLSAKNRIICKRLSGLEVLSAVKAIIFDKTGTLTFGIPQLAHITTQGKLSETKVLEIAAGIERNSLHPFAKAIVAAAKEKKVEVSKFDSVHEEIGKGLVASIGNQTYTLIKDGTAAKPSVVLSQGGHQLASFTFREELRPNAIATLQKLESAGRKLVVCTGDKLANARETLRNLPESIRLRADCTPEDKREVILAFRSKKITTAMVGDGINDAPALALADVGLVFSHDEHTAASEAADIVLLGGNIGDIEKAIGIAKRTMRIAKESMYVGVGLSIAGMLLATTGHLPPIYGAIAQEVIDVCVILNALRASKL
ncbi:MAG TPA: heavy metal translocating P-type ATPase [Patescibacteria group bacterium]|nr:heavy metal translocating P-type ATPase [Patescibacteria group bacterium]